MGLLHWVLSAVDPSSGDPLVDWLKNNASAVGMLAFLVVGLMKGWLVPGRTHDQVVKERDKAMLMVFELADTARRAVETAERKT